MRKLFLLLLLINILFLAWSRWIAPPARLSGHAKLSSEDPGAIRLIEELSPADDASAPGASGAVPPAAGLTGAQAGAPVVAGVSCVSAGPFLSQGQAQAAADRLGRLGFASRLRAATEELRIGSWVRVDGLATVTDAEATRDALREAGVDEAYVVNDGTPGITVSLGVFTEVERAVQVVDLARSAGFSAQLSDRYRTAEVFWLDVDRNANAGLPPVEDLRGPDVGQPAFELRPCPSPVAVRAGGP